MLRIFLTTVLTLTCLVALGQISDKEKRQRERKELPDGWSRGGIFSINGSQSTFTNWNAGGVNSLAISGLFNYNVNLKKDLNTWENSFGLGYGMQKQGDLGWIKTDDRIEITAKYGRQFNDSSAWYSAALLNFNTQMTDGFSGPGDTLPPVSRFMAPGYLLTAVGADFKPSDMFSLFAAPLTGKFTFVNDATLANAGSFGVEKAVYDSGGLLVTPGSKFRAEIGGYVKAKLSLKFMPDTAGVKKSSFTTSVGFFSNYLQNPQNIDVNWETLTQIKLWRAITLTLSTHLIYDDDIDIGFDSNDDGTIDGLGPRLQFKQVFGVGLTFDLAPKKKLNPEE